MRINVESDKDYAIEHQQIVSGETSPLVKKLKDKLSSAMIFPDESTPQQQQENLPIRVTKHFSAQVDASSAKKRSFKAAGIVAGITAAKNPTSRSSSYLDRLTDTYKNVLCFINVRVTYLWIEHGREISWTYKEFTRLYFGRI